MYGSTSTLTQPADRVFFFILGVAAFFLLLITGLMIFFAIRYRRSRHPQAVQIEGNTLLEVIWTVIPTVLVLSMFWFGYQGFRAFRDVPEGAMVVKVTGRMWDWAFRYENGKESTTLYVPIDTAVRLNMTSLDVVHSFYIPAFRVKEDVVPGAETYLWFKPQTTGPADIFCAEYCGQRHSYMMSEVIVLEEDEFQAWYHTTAEEEAAGRGIPGMLAEHGCLDCHSLDGSEDVGPTFRGLYGSRRVVLRDGRQRELVADEDYLRRAIEEPDAEYVKDFDINMPGPEDLDEAATQAIIEYLKTLN